MTVGDDVVILGTGMTQFGMFPDVRLRSLASDAADAALSDSGVEPEKIGLVVCGNCVAGLINGQEAIRAQTMLSHSRVTGRPMFSVENACATGSTAFNMAWLAIKSGQVDVAMVVGAEKMTHEDRTRAMRGIASGTDLEEGILAQQEPSDSPPRPVVMELYAEATREYFEMSGATVEDVAAVVAKNTFNGSLNPLAQVRTPMTVEDVLAAKVIAAPLTRPMCSSITDGAAALVLCSADFAGRRGGGPHVSIAATVLVSGGYDRTRKIAEEAALRAYEQAGVGPEEMNVIEVHDAAAPAELMIAEELGLAKPGGGAQILRDGVTAIDGSQPINASGGLLARGHPIGATGAAQLVELTNQLLGKAGEHQVTNNPRFAIAENAGGIIPTGGAACVVTILRAES